MQNNFPSGTYTIDRFEGRLAVLLYRQNENIELIVEKSSLPNGVEKGSLLQLEIKNTVITTAKLLTEETENIRKQNHELLQKLIKKH